MWGLAYGRGLAKMNYSRVLTCIYLYYAACRLNLGLNYEVANTGYVSSTPNLVQSANYEQAVFVGATADEDNDRGLVVNQLYESSAEASRDMGIFPESRSSTLRAIRNDIYGSTRSIDNPLYMTSESHSDQK